MNLTHNPTRNPTRNPSILGYELVESNKEQHIKVDWFIIFLIILGILIILLVLVKSKIYFSLQQQNQDIVYPIKGHERTNPAYQRTAVTPLYVEPNRIERNETYVPMSLTDRPMLVNTTYTAVPYLDELKNKSQYRVLKDEDNTIQNNADQYNHLFEDRLYDEPNIPNYIK
jgi:hypothetical protein